MKDTGSFWQRFKGLVFCKLCRQGQALTIRQWPCCTADKPCQKKCSVVAASVPSATCLKHSRGVLHKVTKTSCGRNLGSLWANSALPHHLDRYHAVITRQTLGIENQDSHIVGIDIIGLCCIVAKFHCDIIVSPAKEAQYMFHYGVQSILHPWHQFHHSRKGTVVVVVALTGHSSPQPSSDKKILDVSRECPKLDGLVAPQAAQSTVVNNPGSAPDIQALHISVKNDHQGVHPPY